MLIFLQYSYELSTTDPGCINPILYTLLTTLPKPLISAQVSILQVSTLNWKQCILNLKVDSELIVLE